jgi:tetratricopeptide (TPR) repeat protein
VKHAQVHTNSKERSMVSRQNRGLAPNSLPRRQPGFVGREAELRWLRRALKPGRTVAIGGAQETEGLGRTALALEAAHRAAGRFRDGVLWADCRRQDLANVAALWGAACGASPPGDNLAALAAAWRRLAGDREALLVLDDVQPGQEIALLCPQRGRSTVLITMRSPGEPPLPGAQSWVLAPFDHSEALSLAGAVLGPDAVRAGAGAARRLFERLDYLPLALSVALHQARAEAWSLAELERKLAETTAQRDDDGTRAALEMAWESLPADLQEALAALVPLSAAPGFASGALAAALAIEIDDAQARLDRLAARSLLVMTGKQTWSLHPRVGEFVAGRRQAPEAVPLRLAHYALQLTRAASDRYRQRGEASADLALFDLAWPYLRAGQAWAAAQAGDNIEAARLCSNYAAAAAPYLDRRLPARERVLWLEAASRAAHALGDPAAEQAHLTALGQAYHALGEAQRAAASYEAALAAARDVDDRRLEARALGELGRARAALGESERAIACHEEALAIARELGDHELEVSALEDLGSACAGLGQARRAIDAYEQALALSRGAGDRAWEGRLLRELAGTCYLLGEAQQAIGYGEQALALSHQAGDRRGAAKALNHLSLAYAESGQLHEAIACGERALALSRQAGDRPLEGTVLGNLGNAHLSQGDAQRAARCYEEALAIAREQSDRRREGALLGNLGLAYAGLGETRQAIACHESSLALHRELGDLRGQTADLANLGTALNRLKATARASDAYERALALARELGDRQSEAVVCWNLALLYEDSDPDRAAELREAYLACQQALA